MTTVCSFLNPRSSPPGEECLKWNSCKGSDAPVNLICHFPSKPSWSNRQFCGILSLGLLSWLKYCDLSFYGNLFKLLLLPCTSHSHCSTTLISDSSLGEKFYESSLIFKNELQKYISPIVALDGKATFKAHPEISLNYYGWCLVQGLELCYVAYEYVVDSSIGSLETPLTEQSVFLPFLI